MAAPVTHYVKSDDVHIAYQVVGDGPQDLLFVPGFVSHVEALWQVPARSVFFAAWHHSERKSIRIKEYPEDTGGGPLMQFDVGRYLGPPRYSEARLELHVKPVRHPKAARPVPRGPWVVQQRDFRYCPVNGHRRSVGPLPKSAKSRSLTHPITSSSKGEHLAAMVNRQPGLPQSFGGFGIRSRGSPQHWRHRR
jgi:hypothetical protein